MTKQNLMLAADTMNDKTAESKITELFSEVSLRAGALTCEYDLYTNAVLSSDLENSFFGEQYVGAVLETVTNHFEYFSKKIDEIQRLFKELIPGGGPS